MRTVPTALAIAALSLSCIPAALADTGSVEIKSTRDFAIKRGAVPGCATLVDYTDDGKILTVTCDTQQAFEVGVQVSDDLDTSCSSKNSKYVCTVRKR